jgi:hypothetical protein
MDGMYGETGRGEEEEDDRGRRMTREGRKEGKMCSLRRGQRIVIERDELGAARVRLRDHKMHALSALARITRRTKRQK